MDNEITFHSLLTRAILVPSTQKSQHSCCLGQQMLRHVQLLQVAAACSSCRFGEIAHLSVSGCSIRHQFLLCLSSCAASQLSWRFPAIVSWFVQVSEQQNLAQQLKQQCSTMAAALPFASTTIVRASSTTQAEVYYGLAKAVDVSSQTGAWLAGSVTEDTGTGVLHFSLVSEHNARVLMLK